jgi:hypothetical protein
MKTAFLIIGAAVLAFFGFGAIVSNTPEGQERSKQRDVISRCWDEQKRKSLEPAAARALAAICEKMEQDFRSKWGVNP